MTAITDFHHKDCEKIDPSMVNAYLEIKLDPLNPTGIMLDSSWGESLLDLESIIKAGETRTYLKLDPAENPEYLEYDGEDGIPQCIHGDDLSRIISMKYLKDVDQTTPPADGDVYIYDAQTGKFKTFNLAEFVQNVNNSLSVLRSRITTLEGILDRPEGTPTNARVVWGNINEYSDSTNTNQKTSGFYSHSINTEVINDLRQA